MNSHLQFPTNDFEVADVEADGHCFFRAISYLVHQDESLYRNIRHEMYNFVAKNHEKSPYLKLENLSAYKVRYLSEMNEPYANMISWGTTDSCPIVVSNLFKRPLVILTKRIEAISNVIVDDVQTQLPRLTKVNEWGPPMYLYMATPSHFEPMVPKSNTSRWPIRMVSDLTPLERRQLKDLNCFSIDMSSISDLK